MNKVTIALIDNHKLFRQGMGNLLSSFGYEVFGKYPNGKDLTSNIEFDKYPAFVFAEISIIQMDNYALGLWLKENYPAINIIALCMDEAPKLNEFINNGVKGFIFKDIDPNEIKRVIKSVLTKGFYYARR